MVARAAQVEHITLPFFIFDLPIHSERYYTYHIYQVSQALHFPSRALTMPSPSTISTSIRAVDDNQIPA